MEETNVLTPEAPEEKKRPGGGKRALQICLAVVLLAGAVCFAVMGIGELTGGQEAGEEPAFFDATASPATRGISATVSSPDRQYLEFNMLTDPVATFTLGENHGIYLAFYADDTGIYPYLVCLSQQDFERYQDIYEFTFDDRDIGDGPGFATVYGYSEKISGELKDYAIEYFNYFTDTDLLNDGNFEEYLGSYYVPYVTLAVMTFPAITEATQSPIAGWAAMGVGLVCAWFGLGMLPVAILCCGTVIVLEAILL